MKRNYTLFNTFEGMNDDYTLVPPPAKFKALKSFLLASFTLFAAVIMASCEFWHQPVREYLETWTMEVAIEKYELFGVESYTDKDGNLCIPSGQDVPVTLFMRNPKHFVLDQSSNIVKPVTFPEIQPDAQDTTLLHFTYSSDYLKDFDGSEDNEIGSTLTVIHPKNQTRKEYTFSLKCNSRPPLIEDAAIMTTGPADNQTYVLAFRCPDPDVCGTNGIHHDIVSITINGQLYSAVPDAGGILTFGDDRFKTERPNPLQALNRKFDAVTPNAVYFLSGEAVPTNRDDAKAKTYTIGYTDRAGLESFVTVEATEPKMSVPIVKNNSGSQLVEGSENVLSIDQNQAYSTITIELPAVDDTDESVTDCSPKVCWVLTDCDGKEVIQTDPAVTSPSGNSVNLKIPTQGQYTLETWAIAQGHRDSVKKTYQLNLVYEELMPPVVKNGDVTLTSGSSQNNYVMIDQTLGSASITVEIQGQAVGGGTVDEVTVLYSYQKDGASDEPIAGNIPDSSTTLSDFTAGYWTLTLTASKTGFTSSTVSYRIRAFSNHLYVKSEGNDTDYDGSQAHPFATINRAAQEIKTYSQSTVEYTIHVMDTITLTQTQKLESTVLDGKAAKITLTGDSSAGILDGNNSVNVLSISTTVPVTITNLTIQNGKTSGGGGGINAASGTDLTLDTGAILSGNESTSSSTGGGAVFTYGTLTLNAACFLTGNMATNGYGGAIYMGSGSSVTINGGTIGTSYSSSASASKNTAKSGGGAIYVGSSSTLTASGGTIGYNYSDDMGGAIYNVGTCTLSGASVIGNQASSYGGGIYNTSSLSIQDGITIKENYVSGGSPKGGGIYNNNTLSMSGGTIKSNTLNGDSGQGGGVYNAGTFTMSGGKIDSNSANGDSGQGGGVYNAGTFTMSDGTIEGNTASAITGKGGGIYNNSTSCTIKGTFQNNSCGQKGGAIYAAETFTLQKGSDLKGSSSSKKINDIYLADGKKITTSNETYNSDTATITMETWKRNETVLSNGTNYQKFSVTHSNLEIGSNGKLKLKGRIKIKHSLNISNTRKVSPSQFQLKEKGETNPNNYTNAFSNNSTCTIYVYDNGTKIVDGQNSSTSPKVYVPTTGYLDVVDGIDTPYKFGGWQYYDGSSYNSAAGATYYNDDILKYVDPDTNEITLTAVWEEASGLDARKVWEVMVYDTDFYYKHSTFHVWTDDQFKQIFDGSDIKSLCRVMSDFKDKIIYIEDKIGAGTTVNIKASSDYTADGYDAGISFKGTLIGNDKEISVNVSGSSKASANIGLLASLDGGIISNVKLSGTVSASNMARVGGIVGVITYNGGTITGCKVSSNISASNTNINTLVGGIAGMATGGTITSCEVLGTVTGYARVGGIVGNAAAITGSYSTITGNTFNGTVNHNGSGGSVGLIVGIKEPDAIVNGNTASGTPNRNNNNVIVTTNQ